ncbi:hypothetical protein E6C27_scaffold1220G00390 [Cucumis melo var. makuwa]|uniref:Uncharacterized protein n=1 Tax=Cucumis melo var. makuwa TaxID=1194695 RepID=A0A5A7SJP2_CUCMM|nr:hypothetical protein E6C27_scaffold1220G00390 [Cucumis melo var. makuwa]
MSVDFSFIHVAHSTKSEPPYGFSCSHLILPCAQLSNSLGTLPLLPHCVGAQVLGIYNKFSWSSILQLLRFDSLDFNLIKQLRVVYLASTVSYGITTCCVSFGITKLVCASHEITRLMVPPNRKLIVFTLNGTSSGSFTGEYFFLEDNNGEKKTEDNELEIAESSVDYSRLGVTKHFSMTDIVEENWEEINERSGMKT